MTRRTLYLVTLGVFLAYTAWMIGPYVRSTIVRDSSVTTWARFAVAPIKGRIVGGLPDVGSVVDDEGIVTTIRNTHLVAEERGLDEVRDRKVIAEARLQDSQTYLADLDRHRAELGRVRAQMAAAFKTQLEIRIASLREQITQNDASIEIVERMVERERGLANRGAVSKASLDETLLRLSELRATRAEQKVDLDFALVRLRQAAVSSSPRMEIRPPGSRWASSSWTRRPIGPADRRTSRSLCSTRRCVTWRLRKTLWRPCARRPCASRRAAPFTACSARPMPR